MAAPNRWRVTLTLRNDDNIVLVVVLEPCGFSREVRPGRSVSVLCEATTIQPIEIGKEGSDIIVYAYRGADLTFVDE